MKEFNLEECLNEEDYFDRAFEKNFDEYLEMKDAQETLENDRYEKSIRECLFIQEQLTIENVAILGYN